MEAEGGGEPGLVVYFEEAEGGDGEGEGHGEVLEVREAMGVKKNGWVDIIMKCDSA